MTFEMKLMDKYQEGLQEGLKQGQAQGLEKGLEQGLEQGLKQAYAKQEEINRIHTYLIANNMADEVLKALNDPEYQELLLRKYQNATMKTED